MDNRTVRIRFLGGAEAIGASCALVEIDGARVLIDGGVRLQGPLAERLPDLSGLEGEPPPAAILVTHAHLDHIGALPVLAQRYPAAPIHATPPTIALMRIQLLDALKVMEAGSEAEEEAPLYSRADVEALLSRTVPVRPYAPFEPVPGGPQATYFLAGHILGASSIGLEGRAARVLFTGDVSTGNQRTVPGMSPPGFRPHLVVSESTYGARLHADRAEEEERLVRMVGEVIDGRGKVLFPTFAIGRAQEVILILIQAMLTRRLRRFPVHVDGLVRNVCQVYREFPEYLQPRLKRRVERFGDPFFDILENVRPVAGERRRQEILEGPPCAIVASSGMLTGGASPIYARELVHGPENLIAITGYQDEESPGRRLLEAAAGRASAIAIGGREVKVACRVEAYGLSAHADGEGLKRLLRALSPRDILLVHGNPQARAELAELLSREGEAGVGLPRNGEEIALEPGEGGGVAGSRPAPPPEAAAPPRAPRKRPARAPRDPGDHSPLRMEVDRAFLAITEAFQGLPHRPAAMNLHPGPDRINPVIRLSFISPEVGKRYRPLIERLSTETGWGLRVAPEPDREAIREEAIRLLAPSGRIRRGPKLLERERAVSLEVEGAPDGGEALRSEFRETTGYELRVVWKRPARR